MEDSEYMFSSNGIRLSLSEWGWVAAICMIVGYLIPVVWSTAEQYTPVTAYRVPYTISDDYWVFQHWCKFSSQQYPFLVLGDSVIWGQYVKPQHTLTECLNRRAGKSQFANLGVDGIHPVAMLGLVKYYGGTISNKSVVVHFNPLWMSSTKQDLQGKEEFRFNHPRLVPQVIPDLACYNPSLHDILAVAAERHVSFFTWVNHIKRIHFENMNLQEWTVMNPYRNPLTAVTLQVPGPKDKAKGRAVSWQQRGIRKQDFPWVQPEDSLQWSEFRSLIQLLTSRDNRVFVILGPLNHHVMTERSKVKYEDIKGQIERRLKETGVAHCSIAELPSQYYADASHPLKEGYAQIADMLYQNESFQEWIVEKGKTEK